MVLVFQVRREVDGMTSSQLPAKLRATLPRRRLTKDSVADLTLVSGDWVAALKNKGAGSFVTLPGGTPASLSEVQLVINRFYRDRFDRASQRVLVNAEGTGQLAIWNGLISELSHRLLHLELLEANWPEGHDYRDPNRWYRHFARVKDCREAVNEATGNCSRMGLALMTATNRLRPLPPESADIWSLLSGRILNAAELADELDRDETAIRKTIQRMRRDGRNVSNIGQRGYFRPDAPPADNLLEGSRTAAGGSQTSH